MATHPSAIKRARQNAKRRVRNVHVESRVKSAVKRVRTALEGNDVEEARKALAKTVPMIQKTRSKGVFHKNTIARKISRLTKSVNALTPKGA